MHILRRNLHPKEQPVDNYQDIAQSHATGRSRRRTRNFRPKTAKSSTNRVSWPDPARCTVNISYVSRIHGILCYNVAKIGSAIVGRMDVWLMVIDDSRFGERFVDLSWEV